MTASITQSVVPRTAVRQSNVGRARMLTSFRQKGAIDHTTAALIFGIAAVAIVGMLGFFYLQQVVHTASQGEDVQQLETNISDLKEKQRVLELEGAQLRSLKNVEGDAKELNLVPTEKVSYLAPVPDHLAARLP